jgi:hypothetical protein
MLPSHAALWAFTGSPLMSACQTLLAGRMGQLGAVGGALAHAGETEASASPAPTAMRAQRMLIHRPPGWGR